MFLPMGMTIKLPMNDPAAAEGAEGGGGGAGTGTAAPTDEPTGSLLDLDPATGKPAAPAAKPANSGRPDWLPEKFAVAGDDGKVDLSKSAEKALSAYSTLERKLTESTMQGAEGAPVDEEGKPVPYALNLPEGWTETGNEPDEDNPLVQAFLEHARSHNASQAFVDKMYATFVENEYISDEAFAREEVAKLGPTAATTMNAVKEWAQANLDADGLKLLREATKTAAGIQLVKHLIENNLQGATRIPSEPGGSAPKGLAEIRAQIHTNEYHAQTPAGELFRQKVDAELAQWYKDHGAG